MINKFKQYFCKHEYIEIPYTKPEGLLFHVVKGFKYCKKCKKIEPVISLVELEKYKNTFVNMINVVTNFENGVGSIGMRDYMRKIEKMKALRDNK